MKRLLFLALFLPLLSLLTVSVGCTKKQSDVDSDRPKEKFVAGQKGGAIAKAPAKTPIKAGDGIIRGRVTLAGEKPIMTPISTMTTHKDAPICLAGADFEKRDQKWIVGDDNGVANVVVSLKAPAGKYFEPGNEDKKLASEKKVVVRQPHCAFIPHVSAVFPSYWNGKELQATGEKFIVINDASVNHNTAWVGGPLTNPRGSTTISPKGELPINLVPESQPVQISCDIHPWMNGRVWVFDHPYFAVTDVDGKFELKNVPTDMEIGLVAWHEAKDYFLPGGKEGTKKKFNPGENKEDLTISAK